MASLDKLEGEAVEGIALALLVALVVMAYLSWKAGKALNPAAWLKAIADWLSGLLQNVQTYGGGHANTGLPGSTSGSAGGTGQYDVVTGTNLGVQSDGSIGPGPDPLAIAYDPLQTLNDLPTTDYTGVGA